MSAVNRELTPALVRRYIDGCGSACPYCDSPEIEAGRFEAGRVNLDQQGSQVADALTQARDRVTQHLDRALEIARNRCFARSYLYRLIEHIALCSFHGRRHNYPNVPGRATPVALVAQNGPANQSPGTS